MTTFEQILDKHNDHQIAIFSKFHRNKSNPTPGLLCIECHSFIKWLSMTEKKELLEAGVDDLGAQFTWNTIRQLKKKRIISVDDLGI